MTDSSNNAGQTPVDLTFNILIIKLVNKSHRLKMKDLRPVIYTLPFKHFRSVRFFKCF